MFLVTTIEMIMTGLKNNIIFIFQFKIYFVAFLTSLDIFLPDTYLAFSILFPIVMFLVSRNIMQLKFLIVVWIVTLLLYILALRWTARHVTNQKPIDMDFSSDSKKSRAHGCTQASKDNLYILLRFRPGRTGNQLFQIFCLLSLVAKFCYTGVIDSQHGKFMTKTLPYFDLRHIQLHNYVDRSTLFNITDVLSEKQLQELAKHRHNWTLDDKCLGYKHFEEHEKFVRSSVRLKKIFTKVVDEYVSSAFANRTTVAIHVRRTDRVNDNFNDLDYKYRDLEWYKPYIDKAMSYLKSMYSDLVFIFVSDDIKWCKKHFCDKDIYFSPFSSLGHDLALIARCEHMIFTLGTYGWHGAWLEEKKTVIYSKDYLPRKYTGTSFLYPWWTAV